MNDSTMAKESHIVQMWTFVLTHLSKHFYSLFTFFNHLCDTQVTLLSWDSHSWFSFSLDTPLVPGQDYCAVYSLRLLSYL